MRKEFISKKIMKKGAVIALSLVMVVSFLPFTSVEKAVADTTTTDSSFTPIYDVTINNVKVPDAKDVFYESYTDKTYTADEVKTVCDNIKGIELSWQEYEGEYYGCMTLHPADGYKFVKKEDGSNKLELGANNVDKLALLINDVYVVSYGQDGSLNFYLKWTGTIATQPTPAPVTVKPAIKGVAKTDKTVTLKWAAVKDAVAYKVYIKNSKGGYTERAKVTSNSITINKLKPGTKYTFAVKACVKTESGNKWSTKYTTKTVLTNPSKVVGLKVASGSKKATIKYSKSTGATGYQIYMAKGNGKYTKIATTKSISYVKKNLKTGTYKFRVRAYKNVGKTISYGTLSDVKVVKVK